MSWIVVLGIGLGGFALVTLLLRRPWLIGLSVGLFGGTLFYAWLGGRLARAKGEGQFYSWPFGGFAIDDTNLVASWAFWTVLLGVIAWLIARLLLRRRARGKRPRPASRS